MSECSHCHTKHELCCSKSKSRYQTILEELAAKNRALEELREDYDKLCGLLKETNATNEELNVKLKQAQKLGTQWEKYAKACKSWADNLDEKWKLVYNDLNKESQALRQKVKEYMGQNR